MPKQAIPMSSSLMDLFAECDGCGCRDVEELGAELICTECGMAFVSVSPPDAPAPASEDPKVARAA